MTEPRRIRDYEYVARPYAAVRDALKRDALGVFQRATVAAARRTDELVTTLRMDLGPIEVGADVRVRVHGFVEKRDGDASMSTATLHVSWEAVRRAPLFPGMNADIHVNALTENESQIDFEGRYFLPFGPIGALADDVAGHRIVEAAIHRFVREIATQLEREIPSPTVVETGLPH